MNSIEDLLQAALAASDERRREALRVLRGDTIDTEKLPDAEPFLTLREIGRRLNLSPCSLWRYGVPGHELGGRRRYRLNEVVAYLESDEFRRRAEELREKRRADTRHESTNER